MERPFTTGMLLVGLVAFALKEPVLGLFLLFSLRDYFLPTTYAWDEDGVHIRQLGLKQTFLWSRFRSYCLDRNGILLSPFRRKHPLDNFRGIFLPIRDAALETHLEQRLNG